MGHRAYAGFVRQGDDYSPGRHAPLVTPEDFDQVQRILAARAPNRAEASERGLFVDGLIRCPRCGAGLIHMTSPAKN